MRAPKRPQRWTPLASARSTSRPIARARPAASSQACCSKLSLLRSSSSRAGACLSSRCSHCLDARPHSLRAPSLLPRRATSVTAAHRLRVFRIWMCWPLAAIGGLSFDSVRRPSCHAIAEAAAAVAAAAACCSTRSCWRLHARSIPLGPNETTVRIAVGCVVWFECVRPIAQRLSRNLNWKPGPTRVLAEVCAGACRAPTAHPSSVLTAPPAHV